jgi:hypothetical protein
MNKTEDKREEIAIIGGGLGGCLTALMFCKDPRYHVTLIEAQDSLLNGASTIAAHLHLGGEYPTHQTTANDCLNGAIIWKLLMPDNIYTSDLNNPNSMPRMKFLVASKTEAYGHANPETEDTLTLKKQFESYELIRASYKETLDKIQKGLKWTTEMTQKALFGSSGKGIFFRELKPQEYVDYSPNGEIAGGIQTQELGLNIPKYLTMIQAELRAQEAAGHLEIKTGMKVKKDGVKGEMGKFEIQFESKDGKNKLPPIKGIGQVVQAAWEGGQNITNEFGSDKHKKMQVLQRAMLLIDLPPGWKTPPAFVLKGTDGGMLRPLNDKVALCYIPKESVAYIRDTKLDRKTRSLDDVDENWHNFNDHEKKAMARDYYNHVKGNEYIGGVFPVLKDWSFEQAKPRIVIRNTLGFGEDPPFMRPRANVGEPPIALARGKMSWVQAQMKIPAMEPTPRAPLIETNRRGLFTLYPTKATYTMLSAVQAKSMVDERSKNPLQPTAIPPVNPLDYLLLSQNLEKYSLKKMAEPTKDDYDIFYKHFKEFDPERKMIEPSWPEQSSWVSKSSATPQEGFRA